MQWPATELEFWSLCFSIDHDAVEELRNGGKPKQPTTPKGPARELSLEESKAAMREWLDG